MNDRTESLPSIRSRVEDLAETHGQTLEALHEPRLLALWDRPQFVWKLTPEVDAPLALLQSIAQLESTQRIGLLRVSTERSALHPSQTLEREERSLVELIQTNGDERLTQRPSLLHWSARD